jgi:hypothetical protein
LHSCRRLLPPAPLLWLIEPQASYHASLYVGLCNYGFLDVSVIRGFLGFCHSDIYNKMFFNKIYEAGIGVAESLI